MNMSLGYLEMGKTMKVRISIFVMIALIALFCLFLLILITMRPSEEFVIGPGASDCSFENFDFSSNFPGHVVRAKTLEPIEGAKVTIRSMRPESSCLYAPIQSINLVTDEKGSFLLHNPVYLHPIDRLSESIEIS